MCHLLPVQLLWRFNNEAIHLRVQHHITAQKGMEAHTVFVRDIPGIPSGTIINRIETRALRYLPGFIQVRGSPSTRLQVIDCAPGVAAHLKSIIHLTAIPNWLLYLKDLSRDECLTPEWNRAKFSARYSVLHFCMRCFKALLEALTAFGEPDED